VTTSDDGLRRGLNRAAADFLREMARLVESDDSALVDFRRETDHLWLLTGNRAGETPLRETWAITVNVRREDQPRSQPASRG